MKNLRKPRWMWFLLPLLVCLTGCITIEENYTFKKDGSGTMEYVMDASELFRLMSDLPSDGKPTKSGGKDMDLEKKADVLREIKGISKVKVKKENKGAIDRLTFRFADITALNRALDVLMTDKPGTPEDRFKWEGGTLVRTNADLESYIRWNTLSDPSDSTGTQAVLESMHYKYSFKFAKDIGDMQQAEGMTKETVGTKEVRLSTDFAAMAKDPKVLDIRISLK